MQYAGFEVQRVRGSAALTGSQPTVGCSLSETSVFKPLLRAGTHIPLWARAEEREKRTKTGERAREGERWRGRRRKEDEGK